MISPDDMPANRQPGPDGNTPGLRVLMSSKIMAHELYAKAFSRLHTLNQLLREVLAEVPEPDFIEIRAIKYEVKEDK